MGSGEEVRPHVVKNEQSDRTGSPGGAAGCRTWLEEVPAEPGPEGSLARGSLVPGGWKSAQRRAQHAQLQGQAAPQGLPYRRGVSGQCLSSPEKTMQLLFRGAQACMDPAWEEGCAIVHTPESPRPGPTEAPRAARGQMLIGPDGRLTRSQAQASEAGE